jgi:hypothetical protein
MRGRIRKLVFVAIVIVSSAASALAQVAKTGLSPADQKKFDELVGSAQRMESAAYLAIAIGILLMVGGIGVSIYLDRRKKSRQRRFDEPTLDE